LSLNTGIKVELKILNNNERLTPYIIYC
jgi:hypothetical protein